MPSFSIWKGANGLSETRHMVRDLADLRDLIVAELTDRAIYMEARHCDDPDDVLGSHLRISTSDLTEDDFYWLTAPTRDEVRGVR